LTPITQKVCLPDVADICTEKLWPLWVALWASATM
jgi:hypothetical protein